jgi:hypothetical protein
MLYLVNQNGEACSVVTRDPAVDSLCVLSHSTKSGMSFANRTDYWDGLIPSSVGVASGEVVSVVGKEVLVMSVVDELRGVTSFMGVKSNASLDWNRQTTSVDANYNVITVWETVSAGIPAYGQLVTAQLRQEDPGLLPSTKYLFYLPASYGLQRMDRVVMNAANCQVDDLDGIILDGILRLQCSEDTRL